MGKTYSVEKFGREQFESVVTVDLEKNRDWHYLFSSDLDPRKIITQLEILLNRKITPGKTLLFFDEIQSCPRAIMSLRYFNEEMPDLHVISAGSLLEFAMGDISFPVGRVQFIEMYPLSFPEYLSAIGREEAAKLILAEPRKTNESLHKLLLEELKNYCFVGGMPESVKTYAYSRSIVESFGVHLELVESFRQDFSKYKPHVNPDCLNAVLNGVARNVGRQIKLTGLAEGYSQPTIRKAFDLLCRARVVKKVPSASPSGLPLGATASSRKFKAILLDIGLWQYLCGMNVETEYIKKDLLAIYQGALAEQFVGQEMMLSQESDLFYWSRDAKSSTAEVDYLAVVDGNIIPIEVKSGPSGRLKSLHMLLDQYPGGPYGIVFSSAPYAELPEQKLKFFPIYYAYSASKRSLQSMSDCSNPGDRDRTARRGK